MSSFASFILGLVVVRADAFTRLTGLDVQKLRGAQTNQPVLLQDAEQGVHVDVHSANASEIPYPEAEPRIFFLFLTMSGIERTDLWEAFFEGQDAKKSQVFVHCKHSNLCALQLNLKNKMNVKQVTSVPSKYCKDLVSPMVQLLQAAVLESRSPRDKFVFLSESTLPVKPFQDVYTTLTCYSDSDFCIYPTDHWVQLQLAQNLRALIVKHSQWVVLNQAHALTMVKKWPTVKAGFEAVAWTVPVYHKPVKGPWGQIANPAGVTPLPMCVDEYAFFATIFGALVDDGMLQITKSGMPGYGGLPLQVRGSPEVTAATQGICRTFAFWDASDFSASTLIDSISKDWPHTKFSCFPQCESTHPAEFSALSDVGAGALRRSRYLFARKFPDDLPTLDQFKRIILAPIAPPEWSR